MIHIENINSRLNKRLLRNPVDEHANYSKLCLVNETDGSIYENNIDVKIKNWQGLNEDPNTAFDEAVDAFFLLLEKSESQSNVTNTAQYLISELNKVRDAEGIKKYMQYKFSKLRNAGITKKKRKQQYNPFTPASAPTEATILQDNLYYP